jgi:putative transposase
VECLTKDREALLAFYDFPAEHWKHLRTTNPIESSFATVRHRTVRELSLNLGDGRDQAAAA